MGLIDLFTKLFFETTNPKTSYYRLISLDVVLSIIIHIIAYIAIIYLLSFIFEFKINRNVYIKILSFLIIIMILGYFGRLTRVKSIYNYLIKKNVNEKESISISMDLLHKDYFKFYFLG